MSSKAVEDSDTLFIRECIPLLNKLVDLEALHRLATEDAIKECLEDITTYNQRNLIILKVAT